MMTMPRPKRAISRIDILPLEVYAKERAELRQNMVAIKRDRRVEVGPFATFHFESFQTMWHQVHEMLLIEKGGEAQIEDELRAYNPLVPQGDELVATVMFEIEDPVRRARVLSELGGIEQHIFLDVEGERVCARPESEVERTTAAGKTSSVHFVHFPLTRAEIQRLKRPGARLVLGFDHPNYQHMAVLPESVRQALAADVD